MPVWGGRFVSDIHSPGIWLARMAADRREARREPRVGEMWRSGRDREREAHLVGSGFLLLYALLVDGHWSGVGRGRGTAVSLGSLVGILLGLLLWWGVVGEGGEDGRWEYGLKRGEHLAGAVCAGEGWGDALGRGDNGDVERK